MPGQASITLHSVPLRWANRERLPPGERGRRKGRSVVHRTGDRVTFCLLMAVPVNAVGTISAAQIASNGWGGFPLRSAPIREFLLTEGLAVTTMEMRVRVGLAWGRLSARAVLRFPSRCRQHPTKGEFRDASLRPSVTVGGVHHEACPLRSVLIGYLAPLPGTLSHRRWLPEHARAAGRRAQIRRRRWLERRCG